MNIYTKTMNYENKINKTLQDPVNKILEISNRIYINYVNQSLTTEIECIYNYKRFSYHEDNEGSC